jgi:environmental stress-induced protein Ves
MVNFVLEHLESSVALGVSGGITSSGINDVVADARAIFYITQAQAQAIFKYQTDSFDISNNTTNDIKYSIDYSAFTALGLNPANAMLDAPASTGAIATMDAYGVAFEQNKMLVAHDFIRHIADDLFGTHLGVDLFNNETELIQSARSVCSDAADGNVMYGINHLVSRVSTTSTEEVTGLEESNGIKYMTNANETNENLCRVLFNQMIGATPQRFANIENTQEFQSLPFEVDDSINFKLTLSAAEGQHLLTRSEADPAVASRSYEIRLLVTDNVEGATNTVPDANEL